jgi:hypothetical protein
MWLPRTPRHGADRSASTLCAMMLLLLATSGAQAADFGVERVTTAVPFPRGLAMLDGQLYVLSRGRVREVGGVDGSVPDQAGTIWVVDPTIAQPAKDAVSPAVASNARVFAAPTEPPFRLFNAQADPPYRDRETDRPYCALRFDPATHSFYICAFSGIDMGPGGRRNFSKNLSDAVLRYDLRTQNWHEVERHDIVAGGNYPHHDPAHAPPPHGWLNGPDNVLVIGSWLYAVAKDNSLLVRYDLSRIRQDPQAPAPPSHWVLDHRIHIHGRGPQEYFGHSMLAHQDGWLYVGYRTSSQIVRIRLDEDHLPVQPIVGQLVAMFDPYDPRTRRSANLTDMDFDDQGRLYVISAHPSRVYRFTPRPTEVFDARGAGREPWLDLATHLRQPGLKSENILLVGNDVYITAADTYGESDAISAIYRVRTDAPR